MGEAIDTYHQIYDRFLLTGYYSDEDAEPCLPQFLFEYDANYLVNVLKPKITPNSADFFITNSSNSFQNTSTMTQGCLTFIKWLLQF